VQRGRGVTPRSDRYTVDILWEDEHSTGQPL